MASEPIRSTTITAAPKDYSIPNAQQIRLLSVTAEFIDNGAAGDWLPAVVILDNNGNALCRAVDQGVKVTAGGDAEVSWFPGVKSGGGAGAILGWASFQKTGAPVNIGGNPVTGNTYQVDWTGVPLQQAGSVSFRFDPLQPEFIICDSPPAPCIILIGSQILHANNPVVGLDPDAVQVGTDGNSPPGSGFFTSGFGVVQGQVEMFGNNVGTPWSWSQLQVIPVDAAGLGPTGFELLVQNFDANGTNLQLDSPSLGVVILAAG